LITLGIKVTTVTEQQRLPKHVAIIMDGNGRWAESKGKHRVFGHKHGVTSLRKAISFASEKQIQALTIYAFSSENWKRPEKEVTMLMELFFSVLGSEVKKLHKHNIKLKIIGNVSAFSDRLQKKITQAEQLTENNTGLALNVAANYGGRWDITQAAKKLAFQVERGEITVDEITEEKLNSTINLDQLPAVDLMIRTGGDYRISNFLLWQLAYAELYFSDILWPDFNAEEFQVALNIFSGKERRFGQTSEQVAHG
jgi:undecaprenyl diphosphate synthase